MPRSCIGIKFLRLCFLIKGLVFATTSIGRWEAANLSGSSHRTTQVDIDEQHDQEQDAKSNAQIKDETLAHVTSCAYGADICKYFKDLL